MPRLKPGAASAAPAADEALPIHEMPGHMVRRLQQVAVALFTEELAGLDLTPVQYAALIALEERPGLDQATLAALIGYDRATIGGVIDRLEQKAWVRRDPHPRDRRAKVPQITAEGRAMLREAAPGVRRVQARLMAPLPAAERRAFEALCRKLLSAHHG